MDALWTLEQLEPMVRLEVIDEDFWREMKRSPYLSVELTDNGFSVTNGTSNVELEEGCYRSLVGRIRYRGWNASGTVYAPQARKLFDHIVGHLLVA